MRAKILLKRIGRTIHAFIGFCYDLKRFYSYSGANSDYRITDYRNYSIAKVYHSLEKSMSYQSRRPGAGWKDADLLCELLEYPILSNEWGYHDKVAIRVLERFITMSEKDDEIVKSKCISIIEKYKKNNDFENYECGYKRFSIEDFNNGRMTYPENFFNSRYSLREYKRGQISHDTIEQAIKLAMKTPSACNRQPWHVYTLQKRELIDKALEYQTGNRGFGHKVDNLLIIATDLKAFVPGSERYQHWIDGGMFSMSIVYAFHSLGIASCCLNWSHMPKVDQKFRKEFNIKSEHTIMMMLSIGYPEEDNKVCVSPRRPMKEIITSLE